MRYFGVRIVYLAGVLDLVGIWIGSGAEFGADLGFVWDLDWFGSEFGVGLGFLWDLEWV